MDRDLLNTLSTPCVLCPRMCKADRKGGKTGYCGVGYDAVVSQWGLHFGEEDCLVAGRGSGTVFFGGCNLLCLFCQNWTISHGREGRPVSVSELAKIFLGLERQGAANVNFVTPTHFAHVIAEAVVMARKAGLTIPTLYNCGGYDRLETVKALDGLIDIYMPDIKTLDGDFARRAMNAPDYPEIVRVAIAEMHRQVGNLEIVEGRAVKGLLVRHLVMPGQANDTKRCLEFLHSLSPRTAVNVMAQYRPCYHAEEIDGIDRRPTHEEIIMAREYALSLGLRLV